MSKNILRNWFRSLLRLLDCDPDLSHYVEKDGEHGLWVGFRIGVFSADLGVNFLYIC